MATERIIPNVQTADSAATVAFYRDFVGLVVDMEMPEDDFTMLSSAAVTTAQITINDNGFRGLPPGFAIDVGSGDEVTSLYERAVKDGLRIVNNAIPSRPVTPDPVRWCGGRACENLRGGGCAALGVARRPAGCRAASRSSCGARQRLPGAEVPHP